MAMLKGDNSLTAANNLLRLTFLERMTPSLLMLCR
jgi:hypothetical protein